MDKFETPKKTKLTCHPQTPKKKTLKDVVNRLSITEEVKILKILTKSFTGQNENPNISQPMMLKCVQILVGKLLGSTQIPKDQPISIE